MLTLRRVSWGVGAAAWVLPAAFFFYQMHAFNEYAKRQHGFVCGMPIIGILFASLFALVLLSVLAGVLNGWSLRREPGAHSGRRKLELLGVMFPLFAVLVLAGLWQIFPQWF